MTVTKPKVKKRCLYLESKTLFFKTLRYLFTTVTKFNHGAAMKPFQKLASVC